MASHNSPTYDAFSPKPLLAKQPIKALYSLYLFSSTLLLRLPLWLVYFALPSNRPRRSWSIVQTILNEVLRIRFQYVVDVRQQIERSLLAGKEGDRFVLIQPAQSSFYRGPLEADASVRPSVLPATWYPSKPTGKERRIILHFPPGAYIDSSERTWGDAAPTIARDCDAAILAIGYRFSFSAGFPAQLQDAVTGYHYLVSTLTIDPSRVVLSGDSVGGHLLLNLLRYMTTFPGLLPQPAAAIMSSPWTSMNENKDFYDGHRNHVSDFLEYKYLQWGIQTYLRDKLLPTDPYASPSLHPFRTPVPMWVTAGDAEVLIDEILRFTRNFSEVPGNSIELCTARDASHDPLWCGVKAGFEAKAKELSKQAAAFLDDRLGST